jgi:putative ABC transport system ATP-binding protein
MIELENVTRTYRMGSQEIRALDQVDLTIADAEFVAVVGPSGSGKSTLLHVVGGLDTPTNGQVRVDGQDLAQASDRELASYRNQRVGFVFQTFNLQPTYTALENVALPLVFAKALPRERRERAQAALEAVGLGDRTQHKPAHRPGTGDRPGLHLGRRTNRQPGHDHQPGDRRPVGPLARATGDNRVVGHPRCRNGHLCQPADRPA